MVTTIAAKYKPVNAAFLALGTWYLLGWGMYIFALVLIATFIGLIRFLNRKRQQNKFELPLTPNCLLSRYPLCFVEGASSLAYSGRYWNSLPDNLTEHGYEVYVVSNLKARKVHQKMHFILPPDLSLETQKQVQAIPQQYVASITEVKHLGFDIPATKTPFTWRLHGLFRRSAPFNPQLIAFTNAENFKKIFDQYLKLIISLAEKDLQSAK